MRRRLRPTEVKNWFEIVAKENIDVVDQKIYDIWKGYEIGVFYNDTLGQEDRGRRILSGILFIIMKCWI